VIVAIFQTVKGRNPKRCWVLDADLKAAFDESAINTSSSNSAPFPPGRQAFGVLRPAHRDRSMVGEMLAKSPFLCSRVVRIVPLDSAGYAGPQQHCRWSGSSGPLK
jgi:hypothetical protein